MAGVAGGAGLALVRAVDVAGDYLGPPLASAEPAPHPARLPSAELATRAPAVAAPPDTVFDDPDDVLLAPLAATPVTRVKLNHGGTSLSLRVDFASGARAAFKPRQTHPQSDPRKEIAAYRIDRLLHIGHVPPAKPVAFAMADVVAAADPDARAYTQGRLEKESIASAGVLRGELSWWIPEIRDVWIGPYRADEKDGVELWTSYLQVGAKIPEQWKSLVEQLATCVVFDVIIDNADRWTGNNTKGSVDRKTLYFMDNTLSFSIFTLGHETNLTPLRKMTVFPKQLVERLRSLTAGQLAQALDLGEDPAGMGPLLTPAEQRAILSRRDNLLHYIDALIARYGEAAVLALP